MNLNRQHLLLAVLAIIGIAKGGDYVLTSMIEGPLRELRGETGELEEKIEKQEALLASSRSAGLKIESWTKRSLPNNTESARSLYRSWLLGLIRTAKLTSATVDSGSPANRSGLYRAMPFNIRARGSLKQITAALFQFESTSQLHRIQTLRLAPISNSGQFDLTLSVEALMLPGSKRSSISTGTSSYLASPDLADYDVIAEDNVFGIGIDRQDPMKLTILSAVTSRNGEPMAWITEQLTNKVHQLAMGADFDTVAMTGRIVSINDEAIVIESGSQHWTLAIGQAFAEAKTSAIP